MFRSLLRIPTQSSNLYFHDQFPKGDNPLSLSLPPPLPIFSLLHFESGIFGKWHLSPFVPITFKISTDFIKILGVWFGAEGAALMSWDERLAKMNQKCGLWSLRELTIEG